MTEDAGGGAARVEGMIGRAVDGLGRLLGWMTLAMVLVMLLVVVLRYAFNQGSIALQESIIYMHAGIFMLGACFALRHEGHVRVDIFYRDMGERRQALVNLLGTLLLLIPTCVFIFVVSLPYVAASWRVLEGSREPGGLPAVFLLKTLIPVAMLLLLVQGTLLARQSIRTLRRRG